MPACLRIRCPWTTQLVSSGPPLKASTVGSVSRNLLIPPLAGTIASGACTKANPTFTKACDWSHGVPQLFWKYDFYNYPMPVCTPVELYPEYIDDKLGKGTWVADSEALS